MLLASQVAGLVLLVPVVVLWGEPPPEARYLALGALSGLFNVAALAALYKGLALGRIGIVAPVAAADAVIPLGFGLASGDHVTSIESAGLAVALVSVIVVAWAAERGGKSDGKTNAAAVGIGLALLAAVCFGCFAVSLDAASEGSALWAIVAGRATAVVLVSAACLAVIAPRPSARLFMTDQFSEVRVRVVRHRGESLFRLRRADLAPLAAIGLLDVGATGMFALATTMGLLSQVGVLGSLYPAFTVLLARVILKERLDAAARVGTFGVFAGAIMIGAG